MSSTGVVEDYRPYPGRRRMPEVVADVENARPLVRPIGEAPTAPIVYRPLPRPQGPLPARVPQRARWWDIQFGVLGQALRALRGQR